MEQVTECWHNGLLVRKLRTQAGWPQKQLAVRANCRAETISRWESGSEMPGDVIVRHIARALSLGLGEFGVSISEDRIYERFKNSSLGDEDLARLLRSKVVRGPLTMQQHQPPRVYRSLLTTLSPRSSDQAEAVHLDELLGDWLHSEPPGVLLLLGEAGSGKTTALQKQLQDWAHSPRQAIDRRLLVPICNLEKEWNPHLSPVEAAEQVLAGLLRVDVECQPFVRLRSKYRLVFFFDGIDGMATPDGKSRLEVLAHSLCSLGQEKVLVLAALRTALYEANEMALDGPLQMFRQRHGPRSLRRLHLLPLDRACARQIVEHYIDIAPEYREVGVARFEHWLAQSEGAPALVEQPFWLLKFLDLYFGDGRRDVAPRMAIRPLLKEAVNVEARRLGTGEGRLRELLGRLACELSLQERQEHRRPTVGSFGGLLRAGFSEEELHLLGSICFIHAVRDEGGGSPLSLQFRHTIFQELFLAEHVRDRIRRGDSEFLAHPEIDRSFSANLREFLDRECLQILEGELLDRGGQNEPLELNLIHLLLAHSLLYRRRPSEELLDFLRRRFPVYLQRLYVTEPKDDLCRAVGLARATSVLLDRWERPSRRRRVEFVRVLSIIPEALLALSRLIVRHSGSVTQAIERLCVHLAEPLAAPDAFEESVYGVMRPVDLVALYAVIHYHGSSRPDLFEPAPSDSRGRLGPLLAAVRDDTERRLHGDPSPLAASSEGHSGHSTQETHRLSCEWLGRVMGEIQRLPARSP